jgi:hypothetical protein
MRRLVTILAGLLFLSVPAGGQAGALQNRLPNHPSPYLALHGSDPVAWQEWNAEAVARARAEGKLLFVSVGYFSCHWCHVMQRESYKHPAIAQFLNTHFIPVKVDRELNPALDTRLIEFADRTRGQSGWPLNAFITPDGHPLYATLYHPPGEFQKILARIEHLWRTDRRRLAELAHTGDVKPAGPGKPAADAGAARRLAVMVVAAAMQEADLVHGGFGEQSKFPLVPQLTFLLAELERGAGPPLREFLVTTLDAMVRNGLHDQLGGGFFRYTVDPSWKTPHFEKMLYDNAQLSALYLYAARVLQRDDYRALGLRTLDFLLREFREPHGGFIAALSALDDRGVEGGYYLWSAAELDELLTVEERAAYRLYTGMTDAPPFDHGWLPLAARPFREVALRLKREPADVERLVKSAENKLRPARARRGLPRDTKVLAAWNGLTLSALAAAAWDSKEARYREAGNALRDVLARTLWDGKQLARSRANGKPGGQVALEDYAYVTRGLVDWAQVTGNLADLRIAGDIARSAWARFYGRNGWRLEEASLLVAEPGQDVVSDGHLPSPSAVLIETSLRIAAQTGDTALRRQALSAANSGHERIAADPFFFATPVSARLRAAGVIR